MSSETPVFHINPDIVFFVCLFFDVDHVKSLRQNQTCYNIASYFLCVCFGPQGMWNLSALTRDRNCTLCIGLILRIFKLLNNILILFLNCHFDCFEKNTDGHLSMLSIKAVSEENLNWIDLKCNKSSSTSILCLLPHSGNLEHVLWLNICFSIPEFQLRHIESCIVAFWPLSNRETEGSF